VTTTAVRLADLPPGHPGRRLLTGYTPAFAAQCDPRFSYTLFVPEDVRDDERLRLWVFVHGIRRRTKCYLDGFAEPARAGRAVVMTPLFPAGIGAPDDIDGYTFLEHGGIRFDLVLLSMIGEVAHRWNVDASAFFLHGFSGGGQFAHRFLYRHPERLTAVSIGAPGRITLPDGETPGAVTRVPVQIVLGSLDADPAAVAWLPGDGGADRMARACTLAAALRDFGSEVRFDVVAGAGHAGEAVLPAVTGFLPASRQ
jgi:poly(3-hydroxybutyrate) depolymerase